MAIVNCDCITCIFNAAGECISQGIKVSNGFCMNLEKGESTGEIIETKAKEICEAVDWIDYLESK